MSLTADRIKMEKAVVVLLQEVIATGKQICFFDLGEFCAALKFSHLRKDKFHDEFSEVLTARDVHKKYGDWITCEYEGNKRVLVQLAKAGEKQSICDEEKNHFAIGAETIRRSYPVKKQKLTVEIPASLDPEAARKVIDSAMLTMASTGDDVLDEDHDE